MAKTKATKAAEEAKVKKEPSFYIADGKSLTSKKGILGPGDEVKAEFFNGENTLEKLINSGHVKKG